MRMTRHQNRPQVPPLLGSDVELANFVLGHTTARKTGAWAARLLLAEVSGIPHTPWATAVAPDPGVHTALVCAEETPVLRGNGRSTPAGVGAAGSNNLQDWGRKFLPTNGGCAYIDLDHFEVPIPEVLSAHDYVAAWHAMLRLARDAAKAASARLPAGCG